MNKIDAISVVAFVLTAAVSIGTIKAEIQDIEEPQETTCQPTTAAETTEAITYPTETEALATEPLVTLYDVPLDEDLQIHIIETAEAHGIDPAIIFAMAFRESSYKADNIGDGGNSYGLLQVQPRWHKKRMERLGCTDLLDPYQNVTVAVDYLVEQLDRYSGDMSKALTAYNAGQYKGTITRYAKNVLATAEELRVTSCKN